MPIDAWTAARRWWAEKKVGDAQRTLLTNFGHARGRLLVRALGYTDDGGGDLFTDDDRFVFEGDIDRLGTAGATRGCNPPDNTLLCPDAYVTRGQMAAFLYRALGG